MERISNKISRNPGYQHCASSSHCKLYDPKCANGRKYFKTLMDGHTALEKGPSVGHPHIQWSDLHAA